MKRTRSERRGSKRRRIVASLVAVGSLATWLVAVGPSSLAASGDLDPTFSSDGVEATDLATFPDVPKAVASQSDGKIVVAGWGSNTNGDIALVRYETDGDLDPTFSGDGIQITDLGSDEIVNDVAIAPDGKIVVAGYRFPNDFLVARYTTDGTLDAGFDGDGAALTPIGSGDDIAYGVAVQSDGKIVAAGFSDNGTNDDFALVRYNTNGTLDSGFSGDGIVTTPIGSSDDVAADVAVRSDGKIVAAGKTNNGTNNDFALVRYTSVGAPDTTFDGDGIVTRSFGVLDDAALGVAVQSNGKTVAAGFSESAPGVDRVAVGRFTDAGAPDPTFDGDGRVVTTVSDQDGDDVANDVAVQPDGRIVVGGYTTLPLTSDDYLVIRYRTDGTLDPSFGGDGIVTSPLSAGFDRAEGVALQSDGKIVLAGVDGFSRFAVARYQGLSDVTPGLVRGTVWYLDWDGDGHTDKTFGFGQASDTKIAGDWNGDGTDSAGLVRGNIWYLDDGNDGHADRHFGFGRSTDHKVVGDWNGDGVDTVGVVRDGRWFLDNGFDGHADVVFDYGRHTDRPIVGDWNGDGTDTAGVTRGGSWFLDDANDGSGYDRSCSFGDQFDTAKIAGDWNGDAIAGVGVVRGNIFYLNDGCDSFYEHSIAFGRSTDAKVVGRWRG
jgi:uncharacterized delta-60 repeat protein